MKTVKNFCESEVIKVFDKEETVKNFCEGEDGDKNFNKKLSVIIAKTLYVKLKEIAINLDEKKR